MVLAYEMAVRMFLYIKCRILRFFVLFREGRIVE